MLSYLLTFTKSTTMRAFIGVLVFVCMTGQAFAYTHIYTVGTTGINNTMSGYLNQPASSALDTSGNIFVLDAGNSRIQKFNSSGTYVSQFGTSGSGNGEFNFSGSMASGGDIVVDSSGNIYVTDVGNARIQKFNSSGTYVSQFGTSGTGNGEFADPIRQYGVLQPLVVTRHETETLSGLSVDYELIAGERRLRASRLAGIPQVPVIIRAQNEDAKVKLELAIIENLQREDLNPIDRAAAFEKLGTEFGFSHAEIGKKMGKSREYVSNSLRLLQLPDDIRQALIEKRITEGHTRPLMMLSDKPAEQATLFRDLVIKKLSVRETERIARGIAMDKVRKSENIITPGIRNYEEELAQRLGTRVHIEPREQGGKIVIDYFSAEDLDIIINLVKSPSAAGFVSSTTPLRPVDKSPILGENLHSEISVQPIALSNTVVDNTPVDHDHEITVFHPELSVHTPAPLPQVFHTEIPVPDVLVDTEPETTTLVDDRSIDEVRHADDTDDQDYNFNFFTI